jgi:hypothetical protein
MLFCRQRCFELRRQHPAHMRRQRQGALRYPVPLPAAQRQDPGWRQADHQLVPGKGQLES